MSKSNKAIKNIVIVAATEFPFSTASANLLRNLGLGLIENDCNIHLLISRGAVYAKGSEFDKRSNFYNNIKFTYCSFINKPKSYLLKILDVFIAVFTIPYIILVKKLKGNIDSVIIYTGYAYQNLPILILCKVLRIPIYKYSVDYYNKSSIVKKWWMLPKWWMFKLEISFLDKFLNGIIAISNTIKTHYINSGVLKNKVLIIPNIINLDVFRLVDKQIFKNNQKTRIGYVGAAPILNGVDDLIRAFSKIQKSHPNTELLIVGDVTGEDSQLPELKKIAKECGIIDNCIFTGRVSGDKVPEFLSSCDILVMARKDTHFAQAGFPTKLGEYFATKKPVIMTSVGDIANYFTDGKELMIAKPDDPESVAEKITYLIEHKEESKGIAEKGYKWAKENLDYIHTSKRMLTFMMDNK